MNCKKILSSTVLLLGIVGFSSGSFGEVISSSPSQTVRGEIMKIDGSSYVLKDTSGREVTLHVDSNTMMMDGIQLQAGDTITADVTAKGQATYIIPGPSPSHGKDIKGRGASSAEMEKPPRVP